MLPDPDCQLRAPGESLAFFGPPKSGGFLGPGWKGVQAGSDARMGAITGARQHNQAQQRQCTTEGKRLKRPPDKRKSLTGF